MLNERGCIEKIHAPIQCGGYTLAMGGLEKQAHFDRKLETPPLSVNENALAFAMLNNVDDSISQYSMASDGTHIVQALQGNDWQELVQKFKNEPKDAIAVARKNVFSISLDQRLSKEERAAR